MYPFTYTRSGSIGEAISAAGASDAKYLAGGTDILQLMKDEVVRPDRIVDITSIGADSMALIDVSPSKLRIGALVKMSDAADHPIIQNNYPALSQALLDSASPQIRNMATVGGNLLQRTRCPYFRDVGSNCNKRSSGSGCSAIGGENRLHAILGGNDQCVATHPSDLAVALAAFDADIIVQGESGERRIAAEHFHLIPGKAPEKENMLSVGELITGIEVPASTVTKRSSYLKVRDRASFEFALASAAVGLDIENNTIKAARLALGGIATKPWRCREAEDVLTGSPPNRETFEHAASTALNGAKPLEHNGYKIHLAYQVIVQSLTALSGV